MASTHRVRRPRETVSQQLRQPGHPTLKRGGSPGRPKGSQDTKPRESAKRKASIKELYEEIAQEQRVKVKRNIQAAMTSGRRKDSFRHIRLAAHYIDGVPVQRVSLETPQPLRIVMGPDDDTPEDNE